MESWQLTPWVQLDMVIRLVVASGIAALIGLERERAEKPAGLRTNLLVGAGAALFTIASIYGFGVQNDSARVAAGIVVGIGFLGGGAIIRRETEVTGLTTAATIWVVAGIGLAVGAGLYLIGAVAGVIAFIALRLPR